MRYRRVNKVYLSPWQQKRLEIYHKNDGQCRTSGRKCKPDRFYVHHMDEDGLNNADSNLELLCGSCHARIHNRGRKRKEVLPNEHFTAPIAVKVFRTIKSLVK